MKKFLPGALAIVMVVSMGAGCNSSTQQTKNDRLNQNGSQMNTANEDHINDSADGEIMTKVNNYVDCINTQSHVLTSYERYLAWADKKTGPTGNEQFIWGVPKPPLPVEDCVKKIDEARDSEPRIEELDRAGETFKTTLIALDPLIQQAYDYYEQKNYKDDGMAKGKELHPKLISSWDAFVQADQDLRNQVEKIQNERESKELAELEKNDGRKIPFLARNSLRSAKNVLTLAKNDIEKIQLDSFTTSIEEYEATVTELKTYADSNKNDPKASSSRVGSFITAHSSFLTSAKELMRRIRDKVPFTSGDIMFINSGNEKLVEGTPAKMVQEYNRLIDQYNLIVQFDM